MQEKLYTIPVNEAFDDAGECGFCVLHKKLEQEILNYVMGPAYMEEDVRAEMDRLGFCSEHYRQMFGAGNRLGVALMLQSHIKKLNRDIETLGAKEQNAAETKRRFRKSEADSPLNQYLEKLEGDCYACRRMEGRMQSYQETFFYLWKTEPSFREKVLGGKGFCLKHLQLVLSEGKRCLGGDAYRALLYDLLPLQQANCARLEEEIDWFVQKFDYRFKDEPWKTSKDAVERGILKVSGTSVES